MHVVTALNYGIPPRRQPPRQARPRLTEHELDNYAGELLEFREWCEAKGLNFRDSIVKAIREFKQEAP